MATKVTTEMVEEMNIAYLELKTYAAVARKFNVAPSTVKKYIITGYIKKEDIVPQLLSAEMINAIKEPINHLKNNSSLKLSEEEVEDMKKLWEVLSL